MTNADDAFTYAPATIRQAGTTEAGKRFLAFLDQSPATPPSERLSAVSRNQAVEWFGNVIGESGSCLLGIMIADLKTNSGKLMRIVSMSANMCDSAHGLVPHVERGQKSQTHMEIFHFERLEEVIRYLSNQPGGGFRSVNIGILGLKTNAVVGENQMCDACEGTKNKLIGSRLGMSIKNLTCKAHFLTK